MCFWFTVPYLDLVGVITAQLEALLCNLVLERTCVTLILLDNTLHSIFHSIGNILHSRLGKTCHGDAPVTPVHSPSIWKEARTHRVVSVGSRSGATNTMKK